MRYRLSAYDRHLKTVVSTCHLCASHTVGRLRPVSLSWESRSVPFWWSKFLSTRHLGTPDKTILFQPLALDIVVAARLLPTLNSAMLGLQKIKEMAAPHVVYMAIRQSLTVVFTFAARSLLGSVILQGPRNRLNVDEGLLRMNYDTVDLPDETADSSRMCHRYPSSALCETKKMQEMGL